MATQAERVQKSWEDLVSFLVQSYAARVERSTKQLKPLTPPFERSKVSQTVHVVCQGWHNSQALMQYVREFNTFWWNLWRYEEEELAAANLIVEAAEVSQDAWSELSRKKVEERIRMSWAMPGDVEIEPKKEQ